MAEDQSITRILVDKLKINRAICPSNCPSNLLFKTNICVHYLSTKSILFDCINLIIRHFSIQITTYNSPQAFSKTFFSAGYSSAFSLDNQHSLPNNKCYICPDLSVKLAHITR